MPDTFSDCCTVTANWQVAYPGLPKNHVLSKQDLAPFLPFDGIRAWHGIRNNGDFVLVLVGTMKDASGNYVDTNVTSTFVISDRPCPSWCTGANASLSH